MQIAGRRRVELAGLSVRDAVDALEAAGWRRSAAIARVRAFGKHERRRALRGEQDERAPRWRQAARELRSVHAELRRGVELEGAAPDASAWARVRRAWSAGAASWEWYEALARLECTGTRPGPRGALVLELVAPLEVVELVQRYARPLEAGAAAALEGRPVLLELRARRAGP